MEPRSDPTTNPLEHHPHLQDAIPIPPGHNWEHRHPHTHHTPPQGPDHHGAIHLNRPNGEHWHLHPGPHDTHLDHID